MEIEIVSIYPNFANKGGAQNVVLQISNAFSGTKGIVLTNTDKNRIVDGYENLAVYKKYTLGNIYKLYKENPSRIFLSHHRKCTTKLMLLKWLFFWRLRVVHVAHSTFDTLKYVSFYPKHVIAISNAVKKNLIKYFDIDSSQITLIHNGLLDVVKEKEIIEDNIIKVILPGRICSLKRQSEIVEKTKGKLKNNIKFYFAGVGTEEDERALKKSIGESSQYCFLGQISVLEELQNYDYVCLFSEKEGLPLSLIEGLMFGKPLITNDIPGALDVNVGGETGFVCHDYESLIQCLNSLPFPKSSAYLQMSKNTRKRYEDLFTEDKMIRAYKELLSKI